MFFSAILLLLSLVSIEGASGSCAGALRPKTLRAAAQSIPLFRGKGVVAYSAKGFVSEKDIESAKTAYPYSGRKTLFWSDGPRSGYIEANVQRWFLRYRTDHPFIDVLANAMREELILRFPKNEQPSVRAKPWGISIAKFSGSTEDRYVKTFHVHRDQVVATLEFGKHGSRLLDPSVDVSSLSGSEIIALAENGRLTGIEYQAGKMELVLIDGVNNRGGGVHAASRPQADGNSPPRFTLLVMIEVHDFNN